MSKVVSFWLAVAFLLIAVILLDTLFSFTAALLLLVSVLAGFFIQRTFMKESDDDLVAVTRAQLAKHDESFALVRLFDATLSGMREGLLVVDREMRVVASNPSARSLFNASLGHLDSQRLTQLTRNPAIYSAFLDALQGRERSGVKVETFGPVRRIFDLRVVPLKSENEGETAGAIGVFFDITRIEKLERVRQEFLSNVSHELRTPLTAILAFIETLESGILEENEDSRRFLSIIRRNAARMHSLIDDILELGAIEAGNVTVKPVAVELHSLVEDVNASLAAKALPRNLTLSNAVPKGAIVFADPQRLEQMLTNLVENAIKFNREGGRVTIGLEDSIASRIYVEDTGEGIPSQHLDRLFERFYRVDRARSREMGGTGLGLAIVKHLALAHGGDVSVDSKLGEGSTFAIELPKLNLPSSQESLARQRIAAG